MKKIFIIFSLLFLISPLFCEQFKGIFECTYGESKSVSISKMEKRGWKKNILDKDIVLFTKNGGTFGNLEVSSIVFNYTSDDKLNMIYLSYPIEDEYDDNHFTELVKMLREKYEYQYIEDTEDSKKLRYYYKDFPDGNMMVVDIAKKYKVDNKIYFSNTNLTTAQSEADTVEKQKNFENDL